MHLFETRQTRNSGISEDVQPRLEHMINGRDKSIYFIVKAAAFPRFPAASRWSDERSTQPCAYS
jgi:hypothetical protein